MIANPFPKNLSKINFVKISIILAHKSRTCTVKEAKTERERETATMLQHKS